MNKANVLSNVPKIIGIERRSRTFDSNVVIGKQSFLNRVASGIKSYFETLSGHKDQICFTTLTERGVNVISTGITEEMVKHFRRGTASIQEIALVKDFIKSALGEELFSHLSDQNLRIISKLLLEPGDNIEYIKTIIQSSNADDKLNLLEEYPSLVKLDTKHFDKLLTVGDGELKILVKNPQLLENLNPETLEKILSLESSEDLLNSLSHFRHPNLLAKLMPNYLNQEVFLKNPGKILSILEHSPQLLENIRPETLTKILSLPSGEKILEALSDYRHPDLLAKLEPNYFEQKSIRAMPDKILSFLDGNPELLRNLDPNTLNRILSLDNPDDVLYTLSYSPELIHNSEQLNKILDEPNPGKHLQWLFSIKLG